MVIGQKIALVTGASRGIGAAIAAKLGAEGIYIIGTATNAGNAEQITSTFKSLGIEGIGLVLDVSSHLNVQEFMEDIVTRIGAPTILINNAGITRDNLFMRMKQEEWDAVINTNLNGIFGVTKACIKHMMKAQWGRIINISSVVGSMGNPGQANYAAAKAAMSGFAKSLAIEVGSRGITVNTIAPGFIDTDMTKKLSDDQRVALIDKIPLRRLGVPADIADTVAFLVSPSASYITGITLHVNGGMYMA